MKRMLVLCMTPSCDHVLWSMEWDKENPEFELIETTGGYDDHELCEKCRMSLEKKVVKFEPIRFGAKQVDNTESFDDMMAKRKIENRKKSGKGGSRANR